MTGAGDGSSGADGDPEAHVPLPAAKRDAASPVWDMSQERAFLENLLNQRFGFLLVVFALTVTGAVNAKVQLHLQLVLTLGFLVTAAFASTLARSQEKLDLVLADLFKDPSHPATIINGRANPTGSRRRLVGVWVPRGSCFVLFLGAVLAWLEVLSPAATK